MILIVSLVHLIGQLGNFEEEKDEFEKNEGNEEWESSEEWIANNHNSIAQIQMLMKEKNGILIFIFA